LQVLEKKKGFFERITAELYFFLFQFWWVLGRTRVGDTQKREERKQMRQWQKLKWLPAGRWKGLAIEAKLFCCRALFLIIFCAMFAFSYGELLYILFKPQISWFLKHLFFLHWTSLKLGYDL
jgi:hypothetical protein